MSSEVWAAGPKLGQAAEVLHRLFLQQLLGVKKSTTNEIPFSRAGTLSITDPVLAIGFAFSHQGHEHASLMPVSRLVELALAQGYVAHNGDLYDTQQGDT